MIASRAICEPKLDETLLIPNACAFTACLRSVWSVFCCAGSRCLVRSWNSS